MHVYFQALYFSNKTIIINLLWCTRKRWKIRSNSFYNQYWNWCQHI